MATIFVLAVAAVGLVVIALGLRLLRHSHNPDESGLRVVQYGSFIVAALIAVFALAGVIGSLFPGAAVTVTIPVAETWPSLKPGITMLTPPSATRVEGGFTEATLTLDGLSWGTRALLALGGLLGGLMVSSIALLVGMACRRIRGREPFADNLAALTGLVSVICLVGGLLGQVLTSWGASRASAEALFIPATSGDSGAGTGWPESAFRLGIDFWPVGVAFALTAVAVMIKRGAALSRRAEALETEASALRKDTEGLV